MKISAKEEYGLRLLLRIAKNRDDDGLSIAQLSEAEGLSASYAAKITRVLRMQGFIKSTKGPKGGYVLAMQPDEIHILALLKSLDGPLFDASFCESHTGMEKMCTNSVDCSTRSLWRIVQYAIDKILANVTLTHLMGDEYDADHFLQKLLEKQIVTSGIQL